MKENGTHTVGGRTLSMLLSLHSHGHCDIAIYETCCVHVNAVLVFLLPHLLISRSLDMMVNGSIDRDVAIYGMCT